VTILFITWVLGLVVMCTLLCCRKNAIEVPRNYILLGVFTLCMAYMVGMVASTYDANVVVMAAISTFAITLAITVYAMTTKRDFTWLGSMIWVFSTMFFLFFIFWWFAFFTSPVMWIVYNLFGVLIYSVYLIYDTQLVAGGKRYELSMDDYVIAALIVYLDIIMIFLYLLQMLGGSQ